MSILKEGNSVQVAPDFGTHRDNVTAVDSGSITDKRRGINCGAYKTVNIQVVPTGTDNPGIEIMYWSPGAGEFISKNTPQTFTGVGAGTPYEVDADVHGQLIFVKLTGTVSAGTSVHVGGYNLDHTL